MTASGLRRALIALDGSPHGEAAVTLGIDWARRFGAELLGLGILDEPSITGPEPVPLGASAFKLARDRARLHEAHQRVVGFLAAFRRRCAEANVRAEIVEEVGRPHEQILEEALRCDVVVLGRETHFQFETRPQPDETVGHVLRQSPRPVVVVPRDAVPGDGVLAAYGEGREVARTLQTFVLLGLAGEDVIELLAIHRDRAEAERRLRRPAAFLAVHGLPHRLQPLSSHTAPADVILEEVRRRRPRLLVIGAQGHHPVRDLFGSSVTRAVLKEAPVPVLVGA
jgi:nucleotide-binding universal stress UspA family protein